MTHQHNSQHRKPKLFEGLRAGDLEDMVAPTIALDQFKSKMGDDKDVVVVAFKAKEKMVAMDLMEFIEKGYQFALDADMSTGEEKDGRYSVFVELERSEEVPKQIMEILSGVSKLCNCEEWQFRYFKDTNLYDASEESLAEHVPLTSEDYESKVLSMKQGAVSDFFDQGTTDGVDVDADNNITVSKPFAESLKLKLLAIGKYDTIKESLQGGLQLDSDSMSQTVYLEKYLGNYEINKIADKFLIKNGDNAVIVKKDTW